MHFVLLFVAFNFHISTVFQWLDMVATWGRHLLLLFQRHPRRDGFLESKREDYENCSILWIAFVSILWTLLWSVLTFASCVDLALFSIALLCSFHADYTLLGAERFRAVHERESACRSWMLFYKCQIYNFGAVVNKDKLLVRGQKSRSQQDQVHFFDGSIPVNGSPSKTIWLGFATLCSIIIVTYRSMKKFVCVWSVQHTNVVTMLLFTLDFLHLWWSTAVCFKSIEQ